MPTENKTFEIETFVIITKTLILFKTSKPCDYV